MYKQERKVARKTPDFDVHNKMEIFIKNTQTGETEEITAHNTIVNSGYQENLFRATFHRTLAIGSGTGPTDVTKRSLEKHIAVINHSTSPGASTISADTVRIVTKFVIPTNAHVGVSISEMGLIGKGLFNRVLLTDINGNPISIVKTNVMEITIYSTIYVKINLKPWQYIYDAGFVESMIGSTDSATVLEAYGLYSAPRERSIASRFAAGTINDYVLTTGTLRVDVGVGNDKGGIHRTALSGISDYIPLKPLNGVDIVDATIGTGDGVKTCFGCKYPMRNVVLKRNGITIPSSEYVFTPLGNTNGAKLTELNYSTSAQVRSLNFYMRNTETLAPVTPGSMIAQSSGTTDYELHFNVGKWYYFESFDKQPLFNGIVGRYWSKPGSGAQINPGTTIIEGSVDGVIWEDLKMNPMSSNRYYTYNKSYSSFRVKVESDDPVLTPRVTTIFTFINTNPQIEFYTPPAQGDVITVTGTPYIIPKDDQCVVDLVGTVDFRPIEE